MAGLCALFYFGVAGAAVSLDGKFHWTYAGTGEFVTNSRGACEVAVAVLPLFVSSIGPGAPWTTVHVDFTACTTQVTVPVVSGTVPIYFDGTSFAQPVVLVSSPPAAGTSADYSIQEVLMLCTILLCFPFGYLAGK